MNQPSLFDAPTSPPSEPALTPHEAFVRDLAAAVTIPNAVFADLWKAHSAAELAMWIWDPRKGALTTIPDPAEWQGRLWTCTGGAWAQGEGLIWLILYPLVPLGDSPQAPLTREQARATYVDYSGRGVRCALGEFVIGSPRVIVRPETYFDLDEEE